MRTAVTIKNDQISPLFESSSRLLILDLEANRERSRFETDISVPFLFSKVKRLKELDAETLICGAISEQAITLITAAGIELTAWISGQTEEVVQAFLTEGLVNRRFFLSGHPDYWEKQRGRKRRTHNLAFRGT